MREVKAMKHKVLLLGLGFWGIRWLELIQSTSRSELVGVAGSPQELDRACNEYGVSRDIAFQDYKEAIDRVQADLVVIVIPAVLHADAAKRAMAKGMNIIMEKPLAMSIEEAKELLAVKSAHPNIKFMASQNYRWRPHNQAVKNAIQNGLIGKVESILVEFRKQEDLQGYRAGLAQPLLQDVCIHHFDLIRFFSGSNCKEIFCNSYHPVWSVFEGRPNTDAVMKMENGVHVTYSGTWAARGMESSWDGNFTITGEKGSLKLRADNSVTHYKYQKSETVSFVPTIEEGSQLAQPFMKFTEMEYGFNLMMDCLEKDETPETTVEDNFKSYSMVASALKSVESNGVVECE